MGPRSPQPRSDPPQPAAGPGKPSIDGFVLGPFATNCYVVTVPGRAGCWIVDAGFDPDELIDAVVAADLQPRAIILTHAHPDHMAGVSDVLRRFPKVPVAIHSEEKLWLSDPERNLSSVIGHPVTAPGPDVILEHGQEYELEGSRWLVLHTPGHSPGGITLYNAGAGVALVGDTLFAGSIGRTDFPGSDYDTLERSIKGVLYKLPPSTIVLPGHGPATTIGEEMASNPYVRA